MAAIAGIGDAAIENVADERLHLPNDRAERVPVIEIAGQCCGMGDELPAGGVFHRCGDAHLDPELVRPMCFPLADAPRLISGCAISRPWRNDIGMPALADLDVRDHVPDKLEIDFPTLTPASRRVPAMASVMYGSDLRRK